MRELPHNISWHSCTFLVKSATLANFLTFFCQCCKYHQFSGGGKYLPQIRTNYAYWSPICLWCWMAVRYLMTGAETIELVFCSFLLNDAICRTSLKWRLLVNPNTSVCFYVLNGCNSHLTLSVSTFLILSLTLVYSQKDISERRLNMNSNCIRNKLQLIRHSFTAR